MNTRPLNLDALRANLEGPRRDAEGRIHPTPFYCSQCREDAVYFGAGTWYCTNHWIASRAASKPMEP